MDRERRTILKGIATATTTLAASRGIDRATARPRSQQVETELTEGVTLFDLNDDGNYAAQVESAPESVADADRAGAIRVTSEGRETVDYATTIVAPNGAPRLGDLERLSYEFYEGPENQSSEGGAAAPGETFVVVENEDGRHGMYLSSGANAGGEQWQSVDVLSLLRGQTGNTDGWFEYTDLEAGYESQRFSNAIEQFGPDATLALVGIGRGNAVTPTTLDVSYANLRINGESRQFPTSVAERVSHASPF